MKKLLLSLFAITLTISSCSIVDPSDRQDLRDRIQALPPGPPNGMFGLKLMTALKRIKEILRQQKQNEKVGGMMCKHIDPKSGIWTSWYVQPEGDITIADMMACAIKFIVYKDCAADIEDEVAKFAPELFASFGIPEGNFQCKFVWETGWAPKDLAAVEPIIDPDKVTTDNVINAIISSPIPPSGITFSSPEFAPLLPYICPLSSWGCPDSPNYPGDKK